MHMHIYAGFNKSEASKYIAIFYEYTRYQHINIHIYTHTRTHIHIDIHTTLACTYNVQNTTYTGFDKSETKNTNKSEKLILSSRNKFKTAMLFMKTQDINTYTYSHIHTYICTHTYRHTSYTLTYIYISTYIYTDFKNSETNNEDLNTYAYTL